MNDIPYNQPTNKPVPKMVAVGSAGVIITALVALLAMMGIIVPDSVSQAAQNGVAALVVLVSVIQTLVTFIAGYLKKDAKPSPAIKVIRENK